MGQYLVLQCFMHTLGFLLLKNQDLRSEMIKGEHGGPKSKLNVEVHKYITKKSPNMSDLKFKVCNKG